MQPHLLLKPPVKLLDTIATQSLILLDGVRFLRKRMHLGDLLLQPFVDQSMFCQCRLPFESIGYDYDRVLGAAAAGLVLDDDLVEVGEGGAYCALQVLGGDHGV